MGAVDPGDERRREDEFLLEDFKHWGESYFRNEAAGDARLGFFVGVVAAVFAALGVLAKVRDEIDLEKVRGVGTAAIAGLFLLGVLTLLRVLRRNQVTDGYLHALGRLRAHFVRDPALLADYMRKVPRNRARLSSFGGTAYVLVALNSALVCAGVWVASRSLVLGGFAAVLAAGLLSRLVESRERREPPSESFRANVGLLVVSAAGNVLAMERSDIEEPAWQLPQGGIEPNESVDDAAWRELREETGLGPDTVHEQTVGRHWLGYELPVKYRNAKTGRGQVQKWVLFRLEEGAGEPIPKPSQPAVNPEPPRRRASTRGRPEARSFAWLPWSEVLQRAARFRLSVYELLPSEFEGALGEPNAEQVRRLELNSAP